MTFSIESFAFVLAVFLIFYFIRRRARAYFLLFASLFFIAKLDMNSCIWVLSTSIIVYLFGLLEGFFLSRGSWRQAKAIMAIGIASCVISLFVLKHVATWSFADKILQNLIMPIGFSYYIFQAIAYLADIYGGKIKAESNILFFLLYMCFFPKFVSGPIETPEDLLPQIKRLNRVQMFEDERLSVAIPNILYGFFMKTVVADRLAMYTKVLLDSPEAYGPWWLFAGMVMYTMQIYCDFAGYSAIAVGVSRLVGIKLTENFKAPYLSTNITTFWRRWHISLSSWLKNYIYIPLGGNRKGEMRKYINTMVVFVVCGLWHGTGISFIVWGVLHGIYSIFDNIISAKKKEISSKGERAQLYANVSGAVVTFLSVAFAWIFFGASSTRTALMYILGMISFGKVDISFAQQIHNLGLTPIDWCIPVYILLVLGLDVLILRKGKPFGEAVMELPTGARYVIEYLLIIVIALLGVYGPGYNASDYMYMGF